jgi:glucose-6-phosphate dehydrogenase assembly protein OpcA
MHRLGTRHPGRTVVVIHSQDTAGTRLDAEVRLLGAEARGHTLCSEDVRLRVSEALGGHLDSVVEPLTLPDLPVAVWFVRDSPEAADPLVEASDVVVVDAKDAPVDARLAALARRRTVCDLSWLRLQPWRELLANLFEVTAFRPFLAGVEGAAVTGKPGPRHLMAGWLATRLGLPPSAVELADGRLVEVRLTARLDGREGTVVVARVPGQRLVLGRAEVVGRPGHDDRLALPEDSLPWSLGQALTRLEWDPSYGRALSAAVGFAL